VRRRRPCARSPARCGCRANRRCPSRPRRVWLRGARRANAFGRHFFQSHSSSSATSCARPVRVPCPISVRAMRITQVSSGLIRDPDLTSVAPLCAKAAPTKRRLEAERETATCGGGCADHEFAAGETLAVSECHLLHATSLTTGARRDRPRGQWGVAGRTCTASRIRWYVPHGRRWSSPRRYRRRSARLFLQSAAAAMI